MHFLLSILISISLVHHLFGQEWLNTSTGIPTPSSVFNDHFGRSISMDGNYAAIGSPQNDEANLNSGKVLIFEKIDGDWNLLQELFSPTAGQDEYYGSVVLLKYNYLFVCTPRLDLNGIESAGGVFVYKLVDNVWTYINLITASDAQYGTQLGSSIAYNGNILAIGAAYLNSGAVYIFNDPTIPSSQIKKIVLDESEIPDRFGVAVELNSSNLFITDSNCGLGANRGAVFVYDLENFIRTAKLVSSPENNFYFGLSLSATETELAVGSPYVSNPDLSYGSVFLYKKPDGGWENASENVRLSSVSSNDYGAYGHSVLLSDTSLIVGSDGGIILNFYDKPDNGWSIASSKFTLKETELTYIHRYGYSFATNGTDVFVGAYNLNVPDESSGAVYKYKKTGLEWSTIEQEGVLTDLSFFASSSNFGYDVDMDGEYAVIGAPHDDDVGEDAGAAYVFKFANNSWQKIAKLTASDGAAGHLFGSTLAISDETIIIGSPQTDVAYNNGDYISGKVYIFKKPQGSEWSDSNESEVIPRINNTKAGAFGHRVDIHGNLVAISHYRSGSSDEIGEIYLLEKNASHWELIASLSPSPNSVRLFGSEISLGNNLLAVSGTISGNSFSGSVLLFEKPSGGWTDATQNAVLTPSDPIQINEFRKTDIDNNTIIIGATQRYPEGFTGAAYIFEKSGDRWISSNETIKLIPEGEAANSRFGYGVALSGNFAAVSSSTINSENGKVLLFRKIDNQWESTPYFSLEMPITGVTNRFGFTMDMDGDHLVVGAPGANTESGNGSGSIEFYLKQPSVLQVTSSTPNGEYNIDDIINVKVIYSHPINTIGEPTIQMALDNNIVRDAQFKNVTNETEVNFEYKIQENDFSDDLDYTSLSAISIPLGGSIKSKIANLESYNRLPAPGSYHSLSGSKSIVVNGEVIVGIAEDTESRINVYPNPFQEQLFITGEYIREIEILSSNGASVYTTSSRELRKIATEKLPLGVYILKITTEREIVLKRIVKR